MTQFNIKVNDMMKFLQKSLLSISLLGSFLGVQANGGSAAATNGVFTTPVNTAKIIDLSTLVTLNGTTIVEYNFPVQPLNGAELLLGVGPTFTYTPTAGFVGYDSFVFDIEDSNGNHSTASVFIAVGAFDTT